MPADKKELDAALDADPRKEMSSATVKFLKENKDLDKVIKNFTYSEKVSVDTRKMSKKDLLAGVYAVARYEIMIFCVRLNEIAKAGTADKGVIAEVVKLHKKTQKYIDKKLSLACEELNNDKPDNSKALKDGKAAMEKIGGLDLKNAFSGPRNEVVKMLTAIAGSNEKSVAAIIKKATDVAGKLATEFDKTAREASAAIKYLLKVIKDNKGSDTKELADFSKEADGKTGSFEKFVDECKEFEDALDALAKELKTGKMEPGDAKSMADKFKKMTGVDKSAETALKDALGLKKSFDKIAKALK
jgi:hypothetical protein